MWCGPLAGMDRAAALETRPRHWQGFPRSMTEDQREPQEARESHGPLFQDPCLLRGH